ncbi:MAG: nitrophenyl compound nitroreductase subunit ArsF family protein [Bacteroidetes bacterium]|nr:nitrophenyl compound nitroreductase subunit ArsF family protein [Bacteroidota bacterium]
MKTLRNLMIVIFFLNVLFACNSGSSEKITNKKADSASIVHKDSVSQNENQVQASPAQTNQSDQGKENSTKQLPVVFVYNFHITNRCVSCIAIEDATTKTLNTYFPNEVKNGRIKRQILNVDEKENSKISEKYQAFGSGLFVTRSFNGKETTTDLTGDGFKYARNKEERFIEILKKQIAEYLK